MASKLKLPPGAAKAKKLVAAYMEDVVDTCAQIQQDDQLDSALLSDLQATRLARFQELSDEDFVAVAEDEYFLKLWKEKHVQLARAELEQTIRSAELGESSRDAAEFYEKMLWAKYMGMDSRDTTPVPDVTAVTDVDDRELVSDWREKLLELPEVAFSVLKDLEPGLREHFDKNCQDLRDSIAQVKEYVKSEAINEMCSRQLSEQSWSRLVDHIRTTDAPVAALEKNQELKRVQAQLDAAQTVVDALEEDVKRLEGARDEQTRLAAALEAERDAEKRAREAESAKLKKAEDDLVAARHEAEKQLSELRSETSAEAADLRQQSSNESAAKIEVQAELDRARLASDMASKAATAKLDQETSSLEAHFKEQLKIAEQKAVQATAGIEETARRNLASAESARQLAQQESLSESAGRRAAETSLMETRASLDQTENARKDTLRQSTELRSQLGGESARLAAAKREIARLERDVQRLTGFREQGTRDLNHEEQAHVATRTKLFRRERELEAVNSSLNGSRADRLDLEHSLRAERAAHDVTKALLQAAEDYEARQSQAQEAAVDARQAELVKERSDHRRTRQELESVQGKMRQQITDAANNLGAKQSVLEKTQQLLRTQREGSEKKLETQREGSEKKLEAQRSEWEKKLDRQRDVLEQKHKDESEKLNRDLGVERQSLDVQRRAVDSFLKHCHGVSAVSAPSAQQLVPVYGKCLLEPRASEAEEIPALPAIVTGSLPAAWSYLSFASRGRRFNEPITQSTSSELPWVLDTLDRVVGAVAAAIASQEKIPAVVMVVLLQGIAYAHQAMGFSGITWTPEPSRMLQRLSHFATRGSVIGLIYEKVEELVDLRLKLRLWICDKVVGTRFDSRNSALPEGTVLIFDSDAFFLLLEQRLYVIDMRAVQVRLVPLPLLICVYLPPLDGLSDETRRLKIVTGLEHLESSHQIVRIVQEHSLTKI